MTINYGDCAMPKSDPFKQASLYYSNKWNVLPKVSVFQKCGPFTKTAPPWKVKYFIKFLNGELIIRCRAAINMQN